MKYLLLVAVIFIFAWHWRSSRGNAMAKRTRAKQEAAAAQPVNMVACGQCGVHLPATEAIAGSKASYCCVAHRNRSET